MAHHGGDWLPTREQDLVDLIMKWLLWLPDQAKQTAFGWDAAVCATLVAILEAYLAARNAYLDNSSHENRIARDNDREKAKEGMREFATQSIRNNPKMKEEEKAFLGVHTPDKHATPSPVPRTWPVTSYNLNTPRQISVTSEDNESHRKALPDGVGWIEHTWMVVKPFEPVPEPLPNIITFDEFETWTKASEPCILQFTEALRRGAIVHTSRWVNTRSEPGPWAPIEVITIP